MIGKAMLATLLAFGVMQVGYIRYFQIYSGDRQGTGAKIQMASGTPVSGNLVKYDANGNVVDAGVGPPQNAEGVPSGLVGFFNGACPSGWSEYTAMNGRYLVGRTGSFSPGATTGTALAVGEIRAVGEHSHNIVVASHTHEIDLSGGYLLTLAWGGSQGIATTSGPYNFYYTGGLYLYPSTTGITVKSAGYDYPAPYIALRACRKN